MAVDEATTVSAKVLGSMLGLSAMRVQQLVADGVMSREAKGKFPLVANVAAYVAWLKDDQRRSVKSAAASEFQQERAEEVRLRNADRKKVMIEQAQQEAIRVIDEIAGPLRSDLMAIPAQVTDDLALRRKIEERVDGAFGAASKRAFAAAKRVPTAGNALGAAGAEKPARVGKGKPGLSAKRRRSRAA
ncbi:hypothetical protein OCAR_5575 [Afipia carboxidovorans OM5]|nr:hypothetical protein [Afipia carboxidovorans]ACI92706.1 hypothetical protein OCAR_5575 [Afipia carboxidovorans OM5]BEV44695.1 hypothetical protein CRBSH125_08780 [Afipia carboxidovorans]